MPPNRSRRPRNSATRASSSTSASATNIRRQLERARVGVAVPLVCDQVLCLPSKDQSELLEYCQRHEFTLTAYSSLARGGVLDDTLAALGDRYDKTAGRAPLARLSRACGRNPEGHQPRAYRGQRRRLRRRTDRRRDAQGGRGVAGTSEPTVQPRAGSGAADPVRLNIGVGNSLGDHRGIVLRTVDLPNRGTCHTGRRSGVVFLNRLGVKARGTRPVPPVESDIARYETVPTSTNADCAKH